MEIVEKLKKIKDTSGVEDLPFDKVDLDEEFDADKYDKVMQELYNDDYYNEDDNDIPEIDKDTDEIINGFNDTENVLEKVHEKNVKTLEEKLANDDNSEKKTSIR